ncbi:hypothetical protein [Aeoliella sp.]|uniref:hypothetical protein n=1 Tax=Aeoliella sp. TaxID=2795800 RepID=UPI003CCB824D
MSSSYHTNQPGQIPYLDPRGRSEFRLQWSLKLMLLVLMATGPVSLWLYWVEWKLVDWMALAKLILIISSSILPFLIAVSVLLHLEWKPLVACALGVGVAAVLVGINSAAELFEMFERQQAYSTTQNGKPVGPFELALAFSLLLACLSTIFGLVLGFLMGVTRECMP